MSTLNKRLQSKSLQNISINLEMQYRQVSVMLIANGTVFYILCSVMLLTQILEVLPFFGMKSMSPYQTHIMYRFEELSLGLNASINQLVYTITNARYRQAFKKAFSRCRLRMPGGRIKRQLQIEFVGTRNITKL